MAGLSCAVARAEQISPAQVSLNIYRKCSLPTHKPIFKTGIAAVCGIQSETSTPHASCEILANFMMEKIYENSSN